MENVALKTLGIEAAEAGDFVRAIKYFKQHLQVEADDAGSWEMLCQCCWQVDCWSDAARAAATAVHLEPQRDEYRLTHARALLNTGDILNSLSLFKALLHCTDKSVGCAVRAELRRLSEAEQKHGCLVEEITEYEVGTLKISLTSPRVSSNGTGLFTASRCWDCAQFLTKYMVERPRCISQLNVLELGAGSGLCAIAAARLGASKVWATDVDTVLALLSKNIRRNNVDHIVSVAELDWENYAKNSFKAVDVVLASDCIFNAKAVPAFVRTIACVLSPGGYCWMAHKSRNETLDDLLFTTLSGEGFRVEEVLDEVTAQLQANDVLRHCHLYTVFKGLRDVQSYN